jgi:hypothetical protein
VDPNREADVEDLSRNVVHFYEARLRETRCG